MLTSSFQTHYISHTTPTLLQVKLGVTGYRLLFLPPVFLFFLLFDFWKAEFALGSMTAVAAASLNPFHACSVHNATTDTR